MNSEKKSKNEIVNNSLCDSATMSNNRNKVDKSHSDDCDSGSADSLTSNSRANGKFTVFVHLRKIKVKNMNRITIAQININSLRNKFSFVCEAVRGNIDILLVTEIKLDSSFRSAQFQMHGYTTPYRLDRNANDGGLLLYVREDIPSKKIDNVDFDTGLEAMFIEINISKIKWLISCSYNPHKADIKNHLKAMGKGLDSQSSKYDNFISVGDFNAEPTEIAMSDFMEVYNFKNLTKVPTCFKNPNKPSCINLILTNRKKQVMSSTLIEAGVSDFHKMVVTVLKSYFRKHEAKIIKYKSNKDFCNDSFRQQLLEELSKSFINVLDLPKFNACVLEVLNKETPIKKKFIRANEAPLMTRKLKKAIMIRSRLRNTFLKHPINENKKKYRKQRNFCVGLLRKEKKNYFENLDTKNVSDNKNF